MMNNLDMSLSWLVVQATAMVVVASVLYVVARQLGPRVGVWASFGGLAGLVVVTLLAFCPTSNWTAEWLVQSARTARELVTLRVGERGQLREPGEQSGWTDEDNDGQSQDQPQIVNQSMTDAFSQAFLAELRSGKHRVPGDAWSPTRMLAGILLVGSLIGALRLSLAYATVLRERKRSVQLPDPELNELVQQVCAELSYGEHVELRESRRVRTPATFGWRRPVILLPREWRNWTTHQRRVVLAHELAHVVRGDFVKNFVASCAVALHFYHPFVHWLARRLRLEQELVADATAARISGGRERYLAVLAKMALAQDAQSSSLLAHPFLPTRQAFVRRIEMLRNTPRLARTGITLFERLTIVGLLLAVAVFVGASRLPSSLGLRPEVQAADVADQTPDQPVDWRLVPQDAAVALSLRPAMLTQQEQLRPIADLVNRLLRENPTPWELPIEDLNVVMLMAYGPSNDGERIVLQSRQAIETEELPFPWIRDSEKRQAGGKTYFKSKSDEHALLILDPNTVVIDKEERILRLIGVLSVNVPAPFWTQSASHLGASGEPAIAELAINSSLIWSGLQRENVNGGPMQQLISGFRPLLSDSRDALIRVHIDDLLRLQGVVNCGSEAQAKRVKETLGALIVFGKNALASLTPPPEKVAPGTPQDSTTIKFLSSVAQGALDDLSLDAADSTVNLSCRVSIDMTQAVTTLTEALLAARKAAFRTQDINSLRQISVALHNYQSTNGSFPPAVLYGPDGETPYSWRVAILPYLEESGLFDEYKFNEPWDGPNNRKLLKRMPTVYRSSVAPADSTSPSFFALTGKDTIFASKKGASLREITDGLSKTLMVVEAKRDIPWTKPVDIPYSADQPIPKLGGHHQDLFLAAFGDARVSAILHNLDETILRRLITKSDGEQVEGF